MKWILTKKGKFEGAGTKPVSEYLINLPDGKYELSIAKYKKKRSDCQNAYYWSVVIPMVAKHLTNKLRKEGKIKPDETVSTDDTHYMMKKYFIGCKKVNLIDRVEEIPLSTTTLSTLEFVEFTDRIKIHFSKDGLVIPDPDQKDFLDNNVNNM